MLDSTTEREREREREGGNSTGVRALDANLTNEETTNDHFKLIFCFLRLLSFMLKVECGSTLSVCVFYAGRAAKPRPVKPVAHEAHLQQIQSFPHAAVTSSGVVGWCDGAW